METVVEHQSRMAAPQADTKWYVLLVSGKERKVKNTDKDIIRSGMAGIIKQIFLPMESVQSAER